MRSPPSCPCVVEINDDRCKSDVKPAPRIASFSGLDQTYGGSFFFSFVASHHQQQRFPPARALRLWPAIRPPKMTATLSNPSQHRPMIICLVVLIACSSFSSAISITSGELRCAFCFAFSCRGGLVSLAGIHHQHAGQNARRCGNTRGLWVSSS